MQKTEMIDFVTLFGFETVSDQILGSLDFRDETFGDKLGAKVGMEFGSSIKTAGNRVPTER